MSPSVEQTDWTTTNQQEQTALVISFLAEVCIHRERPLVVMANVWPVACKGWCVDCRAWPN